jgi:CBS domain-containing protein
MPSIKDIMTHDVITIDSSKTVFEAAQLMNSKTVGCLVITENEIPVGMITERDIVRRVVAKELLYNVKVSEIMTKRLVSVDPSMSIKDAARLMSKNQIRRLPVIKNKKLIGIVVASDFVRHAGKKTFSEEILEAMGRYPPNTMPLVGTVL